MGMYFVFLLLSSPTCHLSLLAYTLFSFSPLQLHSDFLSNNPSIFVLEWRANAFHLCASVAGLRGPGLPLFIHSPSSTSTPFQQNPRVWFHSALKSKDPTPRWGPSWPEAAGEVAPAPGFVLSGSCRDSGMINFTPNLQQHTKLLAFWG